METIRKENNLDVNSPPNFSVIYDYKLKLLESKIDKEFALTKQKLANINELLQQKNTFMLRINLAVITCIISSLVIFIFELVQRLTH